MKQEANKKSKKLIWLIAALAALLVVVGVVLAIFLLLFLQTAVFCLMFMFLPSRNNGFWESLPGALLASLGWTGVSGLFSVYVKNFSGYANIYGSVYAVALSMLWLYFCISIVFYGGALNQYLIRCRKK